MGSLVAELAEKLSSATNSIDFDEQTLFLNTSANTVGVGTNAPASKFDVRGTMQVGLNDTGYDVTFFGAAAGAAMIWDESADSLLVRGATADAAGSSGRIVLQTAQVGVADGDILGRLDFQAPLETQGGDGALVSAAIWAEADDTFTATVNSTELVFATATDDVVVERMRIASDGKVGIGTSAPSVLLTLNGTYSSGILGPNMEFKGTATDAYPTLQFLNYSHDDISLNFDSFYDGAWKSSDAGSNFQIVKRGDKFWMGYDTGISAGSAITWNTGLLMDGSGKIGIGTTAPGTSVRQFAGQHNLTLGGTDANQFSVLEIAGNDADNAAWIGAIEFCNRNNSDAGASTSYCLGAISVATETADSNAQDDSGGDMVFWTKADTGSVGERMRILSGGNVGIGTSAPADQLHVIGTARINESTTLGHATNAGTAFEIRGDALSAGSTDIDAFKAFKLATNDASDYGVQAQFSVGRWEESGSSARSSLIISLGHGGLNSSTNADVDVMTIRSDGNVGINETAPAQSLEVDGNICTGRHTHPNVATHFIGMGSSSGGMNYSGIGGAGMEVRSFADGSNSSQELHFSTHHTGVAHSRRLSIDKSGTFAGSGSADISDGRLKENITTITDALTKINALIGRSFTWKTAAHMPAGTKYGLIAQELEPVVPDLVTPISIRGLDEDGNIGNVDDDHPEVCKSIHMSGLIPVLVEAVKELSAKVTALENA